MDAPRRTYGETQVIDLILRQQQRWRRIDSRLPQIPLTSLPSFLKQMRENYQSPILIGNPGQADCMAFPDIRRLSGDSDDLVYFEKVTGQAIQLTFRSTSPPTLDRCLGILLSRLEEIWISSGATAGILNWPANDSDVTNRLLIAGYKLDSHLAVRQGVHAHEPMVKPDLPLTVRPAIPDDEAAILGLQRQLIEAHIPNAPFARLAPTAIPRMRDRLQRIWSGETVEQGASLVLVAEFADQVVAMAECQIRSIDAQPAALLGPGRYALINTFCVSEAVRRKGIGRVLECAVSEACANLAIDGFYLIFSPYNPSASTFWPSVGYEPVWTLYQKRGLTSNPASVAL